MGAVAAYFGQDVRGIVDRLLAEQLPDDGCRSAMLGGRASRCMVWNSLPPLEDPWNDALGLVIDDSNFGRGQEVRSTIKL